MENITNYVPETIEVVIPKQYNKLPKTIFDGAETLQDVQKILHKDFVTTNEKLKVERKLDAYEVKSIRSNYSELLEDRLPVVKDEYLRIQEEAKKAVQDAKDRMVACESQINDLVHQVRDGKKEVTLEQNQCYRIPACGHYIYFAWVNEEFTLVRVEKIPEWDASNIFSQGDQNEKAFKGVLGIDIVALLDERKAALAEADEADEDQ